MQNILFKLQNPVPTMLNSYIVDAKSMLGVFSLPQFDNVELVLHSEEVENVKTQLSKFNLLK